MVRRTRFAIGAASIFAILAALLLSGFLAAAPDEFSLRAEEVDLSPLDGITAATWTRVSSKRMFFGHHSVGDNIIAGLEGIGRVRTDFRLPVTIADGSATAHGPGLTHGRVGVNGDPGSKIREFGDRLASATFGDFDAAILKLCFVDITAATPVDAVFAEYDAMVSRLGQARPGLVLVHVTVPLTSRQPGLKAIVKRFLGREDKAALVADNKARARYNALLRAKYGGRSPIFDLAAVESTLPDGAAVTLGTGDDPSPCLARCYTDDRGHLNEAGSRVAARELLLILAKSVP